MMSEPETDQDQSAPAAGEIAATPAEETPAATEVEATAAEAVAEPVAEPATAPEAQAAPPAAPYAVIKTGGKQYRVKAGDRILVERLAAETDSEITLDQVLLVGGSGETRVGTPLVAGAHVAARVEEHPRGEKIVVFKYKPKKRYRRRTGHRQALTRLTITDVVTG